MDPYRVYRHEHVLGASPAELVLLLLQEVRRRVRHAAAALAGEGVDAARPHLIRANEIVYHLWASLNREAGPLADRLAQLYAYVQEQLYAAEDQGDPAPLGDAQRVLDALADAWQGAVAAAAGQEGSVRHG